MTTLVAADLRAGLVAALAAALILAALFAPIRDEGGVVRGARLGQALGLALGCAPLVGLIVTLARPAGASRLLTISAALVPAIFGVLLLGGESLLIPGLGALTGWPTMWIRWRHRRRTRYEVVGRRVTITRAGAVVTFDMKAAPTFVPDRFGGRLGDVAFGRVDVEITRASGSVYRFANVRQWLERVDDPARISELLWARATSSE